MKRPLGTVCVRVCGCTGRPFLSGSSICGCSLVTNRKVRQFIIARHGKGRGRGCRSERRYRRRRWKGSSRGAEQQWQTTQQAGRKHRKTCWIFMIRNYDYMFGTRGPDVRGSYAAQRPFKRSLNVLVPKAFICHRGLQCEQSCANLLSKNFSDTHKNSRFGPRFATSCYQTPGLTFLCCCTKVENTRRPCYLPTVTSINLSVWNDTAWI